MGAHLVVRKSWYICQTACPGVTFKRQLTINRQQFLKTVQKNGMNTTGFLSIYCEFAWVNLIRQLVVKKLVEQSCNVKAILPGFIHLTTLYTFTVQEYSFSSDLHAPVLGSFSCHLFSRVFGMAADSHGMGRNGFIRLVGSA
jgi:hypothetical protein